MEGLQGPERLPAGWKAFKEEQSILPRQGTEPHTVEPHTSADSELRLSYSPYYVAPSMQKANAGWG
jgi:hypothetical protein